MLTVADHEVVFAHGPADRQVAVIVPLHNYAGVIVEALESVMAQSHRDLALVVIDDASRDDSLAVVATWMAAQTDSDISLHLLRNRANAGLSVTRNTGIGHAQGRFCFFLDADNQLYPRCVEKHLRVLARDDSAVAAFALIETFGSDRGVIDSNLFDRERLKRGNYIDAMALFRRDFLLALDGYRQIPHGWEDYDIWLRMCEQDKVAIQVPEILSRYRVHPGSMLRTNVVANRAELDAHITGLHPWLELA